MFLGTGTEVGGKRGRSGQGLMSWAEVGFIPGAEGTTQGPRSESDEARVSAASSGRPKGSVGCGTGCGDGQRFWGTNYSLSLKTGAWGIIWAAEKPRVSELEETRPSRG